MPDPLDALRLPVVPVEPRPEFAAALLRRIEGGEDAPARQPATVRYLVTDLDAAVAFYRDLLGFEEELRPSPAFAMLYRGDLRLLLSVPGQAGGGDVLPDGSVPAPGGWNRMVLRVGDLDAMVTELPARAPACAPPSSPGSPSGRSCSTTRPATSWSCSSQASAITSGHRTRRAERPARRHITEHEKETR